MSLSVERSRFSDAWYYGGLDEANLTVLFGAAAICGYGVASLWRKRLPSETFSPFVVGAVWGFSYYLATSSISSTKGVIPVLLALVVMGVGHLAAYWNAEHKRWWALDFKSVRMSLSISVWWVMVIFFGLFVAAFARDEFRSAINEVEEYDWSTYSDAQTAGLLLYVLAGVIAVSLSSILFLAVLRRIAVRNHPEEIEVIDELVAQTSENS